MIALPTSFEMNFVEVWQSSQTHRFFLIWRGAVLMTPNAIASFSLWWHKWNTFSSSSTSYRSTFIQGMYPASCNRPDNCCSSAWISITWGWSCSSTNAYTSLFTSMQALFFHLFPSSAVQHSHRVAYCHQQHRCLIAAHNLQHFQALIQEPI